MKRLLWIIIVLALLGFWLSIRYLPRYGPPETMARQSVKQGIVRMWRI